MVIHVRQEELFHFESRLLKLSHLYAEHAVGNDKNKVRTLLTIIILVFLKNVCLIMKFQYKKDKKATEKMDNMEKHIKKQARKVEKLQESIEKQVYRHSEL